MHRYTAFQFLPSHLYARTRPVDPSTVTARDESAVLGTARNTVPLTVTPSWLTSVPFGANFTLVTAPNATGDVLLLNAAALMPNPSGVSGTPATTPNCTFPSRYPLNGRTVQVATGQVAVDVVVSSRMACIRFGVVNT